MIRLFHKTRMLDAPRTSIAAAEGIGAGGGEWCLGGAAAGYTGGVVAPKIDAAAAGVATGGALHVDYRTQVGDMKKEACVH